jgi:hypothetical protein
MGLVRLIQRIIALALALSAVALILIVLGIPAAIVWHTFKKRGSRET